MQLCWVYCAGWRWSEIHSNLMAVRQSTCSRVGTQPNSARKRTKETWIDTSNSCNSIKKIYNMCIVRLKALNRIIVFRSHSTIKKNLFFSSCHFQRSILFTLLLFESFRPCILVSCSCPQHTKLKYENIFIMIVCALDSLCLRARSEKFGRRRKKILCSSHPNSCPLESSHVCWVE